MVLHDLAFKDPTHGRLWNKYDEGQTAASYFSAEINLLFKAALAKKV